MTSNGKVIRAESVNRLNINVQNTRVSNILTAQHNTYLGRNLQSETKMLGNVFIGDIYMPATLTIYGTQVIVGNTEFKGNVTIDDNLTVVGTSNFASVETSGPIDAYSIEVRGDLVVDGSTSLNSLETSGAATLYSLDVSGDVTVTGDAVFHGDATVYGSTALMGDNVIGSGASLTYIRGGIVTTAALNESTTLVDQDSGTVYLLQSGTADYTITLPDSGRSGVTYTFVLGVDATHNILITSTTDNINFLLTESASVTSHANCTTLTIVSGVAIQGLSVEMTYITNTWYAKATSSVTGAITTA